MRRANPRTRPVDLLVVVDPDAPTPLYRQVYEGLRAAIVDGRLATGARLPATRALAAELRVARNTVTAAFEQLRAEGYLAGHRGGGTRVREVLPERFFRPRATSARATTAARATPPPDRSSSPATLSRRGQTLVGAAALFPAREERAGAFRLGLPALDAFPVALWARLSARRLKHVPWLGMSEPAGYEPLRRAIATYLSASRGVRCAWEQVLVVSGAQHALDLAARLLLDPGDEAWVEEPGYPGARAALEAAGARLVSVPVDEAGLRVQDGRAAAPRARLAYVTPSHQFPLGVTMSPRRRLELLEWADASGAWVLEDDYDSEFRYVGRPLPSLQGLDGHGRVLYVGTFSKTLFPALRLGYVVVPEALVDAFAAARSLADRHPPVLEQAVTADFLEEGHYVRHLRRMRTLYAERQHVLAEAARRDLAGLLDIPPDPAGMHLVAWLPRGADPAAAVARAARQGVITFALHPRPGEEAGRGALLLGYTSVSPAEIRLGVRRLARALSDAAPEP